MVSGVLLFLLLFFFETLAFAGSQRSVSFFVGLSGQTIFHPSGADFL